MKPKLYFFLFAFFYSSTLLAQKGIKESTRFTTPPVIDGLVADWQTEWLMDPKNKFVYNVGNDSANLYIRIKISDLLVQQKVALLGLTVYFTPEGAKKNKLGIQYPMEKDLEEMKKEEGDKAPPWSEMKKKIILEAQTLELIGIGKGRVLSSRLGLMNGIEVIMIVDTYGDLVYEAKVPFLAYKIDKSNVKNLGVLIETGKIVPKQNLHNSSTTGYRRGGYMAPMISQPHNEFSVPNFVQINVKLN